MRIRVAEPRRDCRHRRASRYDRTCQRDHAPRRSRRQATAGTAVRIHIAMDTDLTTVAYPPGRIEQLFYLYLLTSRNPPTPTITRDTYTPPCTPAAPARRPIIKTDPACPPGSPSGAPPRRTPPRAPRCPKRPPDATSEEPETHHAYLRLPTTH